VQGFSISHRRLAGGDAQSLAFRLRPFDGPAQLDQAFFSLCYNRSPIGSACLRIGNGLPFALPLPALLAFRILFIIAAFGKKD
jgi:hypothetical protein